MKLCLDGKSVFVGSGSSDWTGKRPIVLFLHGAGMDRTVWVLFSRYFARHGCDVVVPDLPGHGASEGPALTAIDEQAEWTWRLIERLRSSSDTAVNDGSADDAAVGIASADSERTMLGNTPIICVGHSMGALVALAMAGQRPDDVRRLILLGVGYPMTVGQPLLSAAEENSSTAIDMITIFGHAYASQLGRNSIAGISIVNSAAALLARAAPGVLHADLSACNTWQGGERAAKAHGAGRSVIVAGDSDRMTPMRSTRTLAELLVAEIDVLDDCGHMVMSEQPELLLQSLRRHIPV